MRAPTFTEAETIVCQVTRDHSGYYRMQIASHTAGAPYGDSCWSHYECLTLSETIDVLFCEVWARTGGVNAVSSPL